MRQNMNAIRVINLTMGQTAGDAGGVCSLDGLGFYIKSLVLYFRLVVFTVCIPVFFFFSLFTHKDKNTQAK